MGTVIRTTLTAVAGLILSIGSLSVQAQPQPPQPLAPQAQSPVARPSVHPPVPTPQVHAPAAVIQHQQPPAPAPHTKLGAGPDRKWVQGSKVPAQYRTQHYVVNDWKKHGLKQPPKGKHWIQHGADYLLISKSNGLIAQVLHGH